MNRHSHALEYGSAAVYEKFEVEQIEKEAVVSSAV